MGDPYQYNNAYQAAVSTMCTYQIFRNRNDMSAREYREYVQEWNTFQRVWTISYYLSTSKSPIGYSFINYKEKLEYQKGQAAHVDVYDSNSPGRLLSTINVPSGVLAPAGQFDTI
jgi:hypothetical protein